LFESDEFGMRTQQLEACSFHFSFHRAQLNFLTIQTCCLSGDNCIPVVLQNRFFW